MEVVPDPGIRLLGEVLLFAFLTILQKKKLLPCHAIRWEISVLPLFPGTTSSVPRVSIAKLKSSRVFGLENSFSSWRLESGHFGGRKAAVERDFSTLRTNALLLLSSLVARTQFTRCCPGPVPYITVRRLHN